MIKYYPIIEYAIQHPEKFVRWKYWQCMFVNKCSIESETIQYHSGGRYRMGRILLDVSVVIVGSISSGSFCWLRVVIGIVGYSIGTYFLIWGCTLSLRYSGLVLCLSRETPVSYGCESIDELRGDLPMVWGILVGYVVVGYIDLIPDVFSVSFLFRWATKVFCYSSLFCVSWRIVLSWVFFIYRSDIFSCADSISLFKSFSFFWASYWILSSSCTLLSWFFMISFR